jgi:hypothetical protein
MLLSDTSIKRPVFASVLALILIVFGLVSFSRLSLREYPDIDPPVVSISTSYPGASASVRGSKATSGPPAVRAVAWAGPTKGWSSIGDAPWSNGCSIRWCRRSTRY